MPRIKKEMQEKIEHKINETVVDGEVIGGENEESVEEKPIQTTGETVTICSNLPHDLKFFVPNKNGRLKPFIVKGNATHLKGKTKGIIPVGAYGVTLGFPKEVWDWIIAHRPDDEFLKKGLVFATTPEKARAAAKERAELRHGYEPINPKKTRNTSPYRT